MALAFDVCQFYLWRLAIQFFLVDDLDAALDQVSIDDIHLAFIELVLGQRGKKLLVAELLQASAFGDEHLDFWTLLQLCQYLILFHVDRVDLGHATRSLSKRFPVAVRSPKARSRRRRSAVSAFMVWL